MKAQKTKSLKGSGTMRKWTVEDIKRIAEEQGMKISKSSVSLWKSIVLIRNSACEEGYDEGYKKGYEDAMKHYERQVKEECQKQEKEE